MRERRRWGELREQLGHVYAAMCETEASGGLLASTGSQARHSLVMCTVGMGGWEGGSRGGDIHIHIHILTAHSRCCTSEMDSTLSSHYTPIFF